MPASSPARFASRTTISPPCSPSSRRYSVVSSTTPYGSLATMKQSSARPMYRPCPLPDSASSIVSGACELIAPIATEPSNADTVRRNDSTRSHAGHGVPADERRDHLGVGGDVLVDAELVGDPEIGVVVDVAVEGRDHVRARAGGRRRLELVAVDRVGVRLGDDADARPPRVTEHRGACRRRRDRDAQQVVAGDRGTQRTGVVAELADLGGRLVDERQHAVDQPHRTGLVGGVVERAASAACTDGSAGSRP